MKTRLNFAFAICLVALVTGGCATGRSTARRATNVALGAVAGGGAAYLLADKDPLLTGLGAAAGAGLTHLAEGEDPDVRQAGFDDGYVQGQSDAIKRQYFLRQAMEAQPLVKPKSGGGEPVYYVLPRPETTADGRKLAPHDVVVRVIE